MMPMHGGSTLKALGVLSEAELLAEDVDALEHHLGGHAGVRAHDNLTVALADAVAELTADDLAAEVEDVVGVAHKRQDSLGVLVEAVLDKVGLTVTPPQRGHGMLAGGTENPSTLAPL